MIPKPSVNANPADTIEVPLAALDAAENASSVFSTHTFPRSPPQMRPPQQVSPRPSCGLEPHSTAFSPNGLQFSFSWTSFPSVEVPAEEDALASPRPVAGRLVGGGAKAVGAEVHLGVAGHEY